MKKTKAKNYKRCEDCNKTKGLDEMNVVILPNKETHILCNICLNNPALFVAGKETYVIGEPKVKVLKADAYIQQQREG